MRKLRSKKGFTLTETLLCVALLAILSAAGAVASGVVISVRNGMIETADAEVLGSDVLTTMANEVRYGRNFGVDATGAVTQMDSMTFGPNAKFSVNTSGQIEVNSDLRTDPFALLSESAYTHLKVVNDKFKMESVSGTVKISVTVANSGGKELWNGSVTVKPLNGI